MFHKQKHLKMYERPPIREDQGVSLYLAPCTSASQTRPWQEAKGEELLYYLRAI